MDHDERIIELLEGILRYMQGVLWILLIIEIVFVIAN